MFASYFNGLRIATAVDVEHGRGPASGIVTVSYNPTGSRLVVSRTDKSLRVWATEPSGSSQTVPVAGEIIDVTHEKPVEAISWHPAYEFTFATIGLDDEVKLWDCSTRKKDATSQALLKSIPLGTTGSRLFFLSFSATGRWLVVINKDNHMFILDTTANYRVVSHRQIRVENVYSMVWSNTDEYFFVGLGDGTIVLYEIDAGVDTGADAESGEAMEEVAIASESPMETGFPADKILLATLVATVTVMATLPSQRAAITALAYDPRGTYLVSGTQSGIIALFSTETLIVKALATDCDEPVTDLALSCDGTFVSACFEKELVRIYEPHMGLERVHDLPGSSGWKSWLRTCYAKVSWCPTRNEFAYVGEGGKQALIARGSMPREKRESTEEL